MNSRPEHLLGGLILLIILTIMLVVALTVAWVVVKPGNLIQAATTSTTVPAPTTTSSSTTTSTSTSSSTTTTESTTTTQAPFYICEDTLMESRLVLTQCQSKPMYQTNGPMEIEWKDGYVLAAMVYNLSNAIGEHDEFRSRVAGAKCHYCQVSAQIRIDQSRTCAIPRNLTLVTNATFVRP